ncbi:protein ELF [Salix suchowensis]|nr:protein ELF [Salix suchowensis]
MLGAKLVDSKILQTFKKNFVRVEDILDQNRLLISEINQNQESKTPDSLTRSKCWFDQGSS